MNERQIELTNQVIDKYKEALEKAEQFLACKGTFEDITEINICNINLCPFCLEYLNSMKSPMFVCVGCPVTGEKQSYGCTADLTYLNLESAFSILLEQYDDYDQRVLNVKNFVEKLKVRIDRLENLIKQ